MRQGGVKYEAWNEYSRYGGLPMLLTKKTDDEKIKFLQPYLKQAFIEYNDLPTILCSEKIEKFYIDFFLSKNMILSFEKILQCETNAIVIVSLLFSYKT